MKYLFFFSTLSVFAQTQVSQPQFTAATRPALVWSDGLQGQRIHPSQTTLSTLVTVQRPDPLRLELPEIGCEVKVNPDAALLIVMVVQNGRVGVLTGYRTMEGSLNGQMVYIATSKNVTTAGPCAMLEYEDGRYPKGINAFLYFGSVRMPRPENSEITGVRIDFVPQHYGLNENGLWYVAGPSGQQYVPIR